MFGADDNNEVDAKALTERIERETGKWACLAGGNGYDEAMAAALGETLDEQTRAEMPALCPQVCGQGDPQGHLSGDGGVVHNLNTMHSRAGAQIPFSSLNYGTDTSPEGRLAIEQLLLATEAGSGQRRNADLPDPHLQGQGGRQL